ncbi:MAG: chaperone NapD [Rhodocyclaceae bacterium]
MRIVSLLVRSRPESMDDVRDALALIAGVSLHRAPADSDRFVVLIEDGEGYAVSDSILSVATTPGVLNITLAYEYSDESTDPADLAAAFARTARVEESRQ